VGLAAASAEPMRVKTSPSFSSGMSLKEASSFSTPFQALLMSFWRSGGTPVRLKSATLNSSTDSLGVRGSLCSALPCFTVIERGIWGVVC